MEPIRKSFDPKSLFPFQIVYQDTKNPQNELPNHFHDWYEIVYVYSGNGTFFIDHAFQEMEKGDVFILPGNTIHYAIPDKENPVTSTAVFFNPLLVHDRFLGESFSYFHLFDESTRLKNYRYSLEEEQQKEMHTFLENIYLEMNRKEFGYKQSTLLHLQMMLLYLNRFMLQKQRGHSTPTKPIPDWLRAVLDYIEENFTNEVNLRTLTNHGNVSAAHLSRVFKQMTGLNISEYITTKKILKAKDLLLKTNENVANIGEQCGFESMPHFYRTFKKYMGMTPSSYRQHGGLNQVP